MKATLQSRKATSTKWINGASANLSATGSYSLKWKAPAKKGKYKIRVRVTHSGTSNTSARQDGDREVGTQETPRAGGRTTAARSVGPGACGARPLARTDLVAMRSRRRSIPQPSRPTGPFTGDGSACQGVL